MPQISASPSAVWYTKCPAPTPLSIAFQLGWLAEHFQTYGIAIESISHSHDPKIRQSHFDHRLDWSFRQGGNIPPIWARASGRQTRLIGLTRTDEFQALITSADSSVTTAATLAGRRIGIPKRPHETIDFQQATALKGIVSALEISGLALEAVDLVELVIEEPVLLAKNDSKLHGLARRLPYGAEIKALHRGEIDAFFVKGAEGITIANLIDARVVVETGFHPDPWIRINNGTPRPLTIDARFADQRPDLAAELIITVQRASRWAAQHPAETRRLVAEEIGVSEASVAAANGSDLHHHLDLDLAESELAALSAFKDFLYRWGFIPSNFDLYADWLDRRPLSLVGEQRPLQQQAG